MRVKRATIVGLLGASMVLVGVQGTASAAETANQEMAKQAAVQSLSGDEASRASLRCETNRGNTGGWARCKGNGTWRIRSVCRLEPDKYTSWQRQKGGTVRVSAKDCRWKINSVIVEQR